MSDATSPLAETFLINDRIVRYLLAAVPEAGLDAQAGGKGRTVREHFVHVHAVRLLWLKSGAADLLAKVAALEKAASREEIASALEASADAIAAMIQRAAEGDGRIKGFKPHATAFVGYLCAHEAHHRGQIVQVLKLAGHPIDKKTAFGLWEWGVR